MNRVRVCFKQVYDKDFPSSVQTTLEHEMSLLLDKFSNQTMLTFVVSENNNVLHVNHEAVAEQVQYKELLIIQNNQLVHVSHMKFKLMRFSNQNC